MLSLSDTAYTLWRMGSPCCIREKGEGDGGNQESMTNICLYNGSERFYVATKASIKYLVALYNVSNKEVVSSHVRNPYASYIFD